MLILTLLTAALSTAHASVNVDVYLPGSSYKYPVTESAYPEIPIAYDRDNYTRYSLGMDYDYLDSPLVQLNQTRTVRTDTLVDSMATFDLEGGIEWNGLMSVNVAVPVTDTQSSGGSNTSLGDIRMFSKIYLQREHHSLNLALIPEISVPTGSQSNFTSSGSPMLGVSLAAEHEFGRSSAALNVGYRYAPNAVYQDVDYRQRIPISLAIYVPFIRDFGMNLEGTQAFVLPPNNDQMQSQFYAGLRYLYNNSFTIAGGGTVGQFSHGNGSADYGCVLSIKWAPTAEHPTLVKNDNPAPAPVPVEAQKAPVPVAYTAPIPAPLPPACPPAILAAGPKAKAPRVVFTPKRLIIREEIKFKHDSDVLLPSARNLLDEVAVVLKKNSARYKQVRIEGYCNVLGTDAYNLKLSKMRAKSVREYLASRGINPKRLLTFGYGKRRQKPGLDGISRAARLAANRRVDFLVVQ